MLDSDLSEFSYFEPADRDIVPKQPLYHKYDTRYDDAYREYITYKNSGQDINAKKALYIVNDVKVQTAKIRYDIMQHAKILCKYIQKESQTYDTPLLKENDVINHFIQLHFLALEEAKLNFNSYIESVDHPNIDTLFRLHEKVEYRTISLNSYITRKRDLYNKYNKYTNYTKLATVIETQAKAEAEAKAKAEAEAKAKADAAATIPVDKPNRSTYIAHERIKRSKARESRRYAEILATKVGLIAATLFKRKSGGMATRKKKYRKRNKTKRNKIQKKRYTKKNRSKH